VLTRSREQADRDTPVLDERIAAYFAENFPDDSAMMLELSYVAGGTFGCSEGTAYRTQEIALGPIRSMVASREKRKFLSQALSEQFDCRLVSETRDGRTLVVTLEAPASSAEDLRGLALKVEPTLREHFLRFDFYAALRLSVRARAPATSSASSGARGAPPSGDTVEVQFDTRGREIVR